MDLHDVDRGGRVYSPLYKACALAAIAILLLGGRWALYPSGRLARGGFGMDLASLGRRLEPAEVASEDAGEAGTAAARLVRAARAAGVDPRESLLASLPEPKRILGMLSLDRDIGDFLDYATRDDAVGKYYRDEARVSLEMRPLRERYERVFASAYAALSGEETSAAAGPSKGAVATIPAPSKKLKPPYVTLPGEVWLPPLSDLPLSHPYALDVFFQSVSRSGEAEKGPVIRALYPGIVVAAASDWSGGQGLSAWKSGGLSPAAGNGLVIYDPVDRVYCSYFHLSSLALGTGSIVKAGDAVGRGGNSGMNARKAGHGEHLHLEIFDAAKDAPLSSFEIRKLLHG